MSDEAPYPRFASRGRAYVYVLPCRDEDLLKLGFSRDPFTRFSTLHRRFFEYFDLDRGLLVDAERVSAARRIERRLIETFVEHHATAPLVVSAAAGGHTEWYRGAHPEVSGLLQAIARDEGLPVYGSLRPGCETISWTGPIFSTTGRCVSSRRWSGLVTMRRTILQPAA